MRWVAGLVVVHPMFDHSMKVKMIKQEGEKALRFLKVYFKEVHEQGTVELLS